MTAAQEIQAAIDKLTTMRSVDLMYPDKYEGDTDADFDAACKLITTLHRTIDAQLAILNFIATSGHMYDDVELVEVYAEQFALARAINGVTA